MALISNGTALGSKYVVRELIGRGGMGMVYRGDIRDGGEEVAIKFLRPDLASDPSVVARFVQERSILLTVSSPHLVTVRDLIVEGDNLAIVMDLVAGRDLRHQLNMMGTMPPAEAARLTAQVLRGLAAVHRAGIVHRDVKPENILLDQSAEPARARLTDFGVSRMATGANLTRMTTVIGTPEYMAPELYESEKATSAADVYSTGVVLYELLTGRTPYSGGAPIAVMRRQLEFEPPAVVGLDAELWQLLTQMLDKSPQRVHKADALADVLETLAIRLQGEPALPAQERPSNGEWVPTTGAGSTRASEPAPDIPRETRLSTSRTPVPSQAGSTETVITSRRATLSDQHDASLADDQEPVADHPVDAPAKGRRRTLPFALLASLLLIVAGTAVFLTTRGTTGPTEATGYAFAPVTRADGLVISRRWELGGKDGRQLTQTLVLTNSRKTVLTASFDDVIPKIVTRDVNDIVFSPSPASVVRKDPVVRFRLTLKPDASLQVTAVTTVAAAKATSRDLEAWAAEQRREEHAYLSKSGGDGAKVVALSSIKVGQRSVRVRVGEVVDTKLIGRLSNGEPAPAALLKDLAWSSSDDSVATVLGGRIFAKAPGTSTVTVQAGGARDTVAVTVLSRPKSGPKMLAPGTPLGVTAVAGDTRASVTWTKPNSKAGSPVAGYVVTASPGSAHCETTTELTCTVTGLVNGTSYIFTVQARNSAGLGKPATSAAATPSGLPAAPWNLRMTVNTLTTVRIGWNDPSGNGSDIDNVTVMNQQTGRTCTAGPGVGSCVIDGLNPGWDYTFVAKAHNANGESEWSPVLAAATASSVPDVPSGLRQTDNSQTAIRMNWNDPANNGRAIDVITVMNQQTGRTCTAGPGVGTCVVDGLNPGSNYTFVIKAHNAHGDSPWSGASSGYTQARPRVVSVSKGAYLVASFCSYGCNRINVSMSGFAPNSNFSVVFWTNNGGVGSWASATARTDGDGNYSGNPGGYAFGFWGKDVWVVVDGVESNHARW